MQQHIYSPVSKLAIGLGLVGISIFVNTGISEQIVLAKSASVKKCDIFAYVTDTDPQGLNIRSGASTNNRVLGRIPANETVQVIAVANNWVKITNVSNVFSGSGWVSVRKLGLSTRGYGTDGVDLDTTANQKSQKIKRAPADVAVKLLSCQGDWAQVEYQGVQGWLAREDQCGAALTTCS